MSFTMSERARILTANTIMILLSAAVVAAAIAKILKNATILANLSRIGFGPYIQIVGVFELVFVGLLLLPRTRKIGLLFLSCHLGGATAVEIAEGVPPISFVLIALLWIGTYLRDRTAFFNTPWPNGPAVRGVKD
jgi:hypothetical protein